MKPFRSERRMDTEKASGVLLELKKAIKTIHNQDASGLSFEELYRNAYNMVLYKHGEMLYHGIEEEVRAYLIQIGNQVAEAADSETLLKELVEKWRTHTTTMKMIHDILMYMDRTYVPHEKKLPTYDLGLAIFRSEVVGHKNVKERLLTALLNNIERERNGELIDSSVLREVIFMFVNLGMASLTVYEEEFEKPFLAVTKQFYQQEALAFIQGNTCPDYVLKAEARLEEERQRAQRYLHRSTEAKLLNLVADEMVVKHASHLVNMPKSGCWSMLKDSKVEDLRRLYNLFIYRHCRDEIKQCVFNYCKDVGSKLVEDEDSDTKPVDFVHQILALQEKFDFIVKEAFGDDKSFSKVVKDAFEEFVNKNQRCSKFLSVYLDELMRNKIKLESDSEFNDVVDRVVNIFRYIHDKDIFESYYKQQLSKRLLSGRSISDDAESRVIKKLKTECGYLFTSKLEGMFRDMRLSKKTMEDFRMSQSQRNSTSDISPLLHVTVLTAGFWPTEPSKLCTLPDVLRSVCEDFTTFYLDAHSGRKLTWQTNLGSADLKVKFTPTNKHEFNMTTYQMCVVMLFNESKELTFEQIVTATGIDENELKRHLISLAAPKFRILNKEPKGRVLEADTVFSVNENFQSKHYKVRIPLISAREKLGSARVGSSDIPEQVEEDRRHLVEAAIVRIMKTRKVLDHNLLVAEVTKQMSSRFNPSPQHIKKRIESLIEREYLERSENDRRTYRYLA